MNENTLSQLDKSDRSVVQLFLNYVTVLKDYSREFFFFNIVLLNTSQAHLTGKSQHKRQKMKTLL